MDFSLGKWTFGSSGFGCVFYRNLDSSFFNGFGMVLPDLDNALLKDLDLAFGGFGYFVLADTKMQNSKCSSKLIRL